MLFGHLSAAGDARHCPRFVKGIGVYNDVIILISKSSEIIKFYRILISPATTVQSKNQRQFACAAESRRQMDKILTLAAVNKNCFINILGLRKGTKNTKRRNKRQKDF